MLVYLPRRWKWVGFVAASTLTIAGCTRPVEYSDLRPEGPPEVLVVAVNALDTRPESAGGGAALEQATFCKTQAPNDGAQGAGDNKRPDQVNLNDVTPLVYCPTDLTKGVDEVISAMPESWYVRIEFDELLDPSVEDLVADVDATGAPTGTYTGTLANTQPVTLKCASSKGTGLVDVPYDGYYSPAGNSISYPLGPSLVIIPVDPTVIATGSECTVTLKDSIHDKDGVQVPADQRGTAATPYKFKLAPIQVVAITPPDGTAVDPVDAGVDLTFNAAIDQASLEAAIDFAPVLANSNVSLETPEEFLVGGDFVTAGDYTFTLKAGSVLLDQCGKSTTLGAPSVAALTKTEFKTNALKLKGITGASEPGNKIVIAFNQYMDDATFTTADYTITPALANAAVEIDPVSLNLRLAGDFALGTQYVFTLKSGASISDCPGAEFGSCVTSATYTAAADQVVMFTTAAAITLKSITPKDNAKESVAASASGITLTFNQEIDPTTLTAADYKIDPPVTFTASNRGAVGAGSYEAVRLKPSAPLAPGTYTFTLLGTASVADKLGNTFSPGTDKVIHFTVTPPGGTTPPHVCL
jgi:methionine-rich copper-binding protein CopC